MGERGSSRSEKRAPRDCGALRAAVRSSPEGPWSPGRFSPWASRSEPFELRSGRLDSEEDTLELLSTPEEATWIQANGPLRAADRLTLRGKAYVSEAVARDRGRQVATALTFDLVRLGTPADFLERRALGLA